MSKNSKTVLTLALFAVALAAVWAIFYYSKNTNNAPDISTDLSALKGCYVASIDKDIYTLVINSTEGANILGMLAYNNYQKDSSSGSFTGKFEKDILLGNYSFDSEGMHSDRQVIFKKVGNGFNQGFGPVDSFGGKEVFKNISDVTYDPEFVFARQDNCLLHFTDSTQTVAFDYHPFFKIIDGDKTATLGWILNAKQKGLLLSSVLVPRTYMPGTNFSDARLTVGRSSDPNAIRNCSTDLTGDEGQAEAATLGGYPFKKFMFAEGAAGNFYDTTSYRGIVDGDCYGVEYTIHSTNIENYPKEQGIKEFDKAKIQNELDKVLTSIQFLINSD